MRKEGSPQGASPLVSVGPALTDGPGGTVGTPGAAGDPGRTFSELLREVSGFTRMDGGADAGGFGAASLFTGGSLASRITELHTEGVLLSPPLTASAGEASWEKLDLAPASAVLAAGGMLCGWGLMCWYSWNC